MHRGDHVLVVRRRQIGCPAEVDRFGGRIRRPAVEGLSRIDPVEHVPHRLFDRRAFVLRILQGAQLFRLLLTGEDGVVVLFHRVVEPIALRHGVPPFSPLATNVYKSC